MKNICFVSLLLAAFSFSCDSSSDETDNVFVPDTTAVAAPFSVAFYNVENLFDTLDLPETADDEFTPGTEKDWNSARYADKLEKLSEVLSKINGTAGTYPDVIGLCEVENRAVLEDLLQTKNMSGAEFGIVHRESPDGRGIDAAMLYQKGSFEVLKENFYEIKVPDEERPNTRLLVYVKGIAKNAQDTLHLFINHWPSRSGGEEASEPKRLTVAAVARATIDSIMDTDADAKILLVGDFNDYPDNKSITEVLKADNSGQPRTLYNMSADLKADGVGTYNYKGEWGILDQAIMSLGLHTSTRGIRCADGGTEIFREDFIMFHDTVYDDWKPSRTYGGPNYYGGYSDHLPIIVRLEY